MLARSTTPPTVLAIFPEDWLPRRRAEWEPLTEAACHVGFRAVVTHWNALEVADGAVTARQCLVRESNGPQIRPMSNVVFVPDIVLTTWSVDWEHQALFREILSETRSYHSEYPLLAWLDGKCELELCLRSYENETGRRVSRPRTLLSDEITASDAEPRDQLVIVKPSRSGQCKGIEIVPRHSLPSLAQESSDGVRAPFVAQELVEEVFLYEGRRWDIRIHAMATSLSPLRYHLYSEGVAKTTGATSVPGSARLAEWLNAESYSEGNQTAENLSLEEMLSWVARKHGPLVAFWERLDALVEEVFAAIALYAEKTQSALDRAFLFPGFDLIVEKCSDGSYELKLLEINSHPGLAWRGCIDRGLEPSHQAWFRDLRMLVES